jgi:hypothetical protein
MYFFTITLTTIGYGDLYPHTPGGKIFHSFHLFIGLGIISGGLSWLVFYFLERRDRERVHEACQKFDEDYEFENQSRQRKNSLLSGNPVEEVDEEKDHEINEENENQRPYNFWVDTLHISPNINMTRLMFSFALILLNVSAGVLFYTCIVDDMSVVDAIYFSSMTVTTVGYGDITPSDFWSRVFTLFYAVLGTLITAKALTTLNSVFMVYFRKRKEDLMLNRGLHMGTFLDMANGRATVSKDQFIIYKLLLMDLVDIKVIQKAEKQFEKLDVNSDGELSMQDVQLPKSANLSSRKKTRINSLAQDIVNRRRSSTMADEFMAKEALSRGSDATRKRGNSIFRDLSEYMESYDSELAANEDGDHAMGLELHVGGCESQSGDDSDDDEAVVRRINESDCQL